MQPGDTVTIIPKTRYPHLNWLRGQIGTILHIEGKVADVLLGEKVERLFISDLQPEILISCAHCKGEGRLPRLGVNQLIPGRQWQICPICQGQQYVQRREGEPMREEDRSLQQDLPMSQMHTDGGQGSDDEKL